MTPERIADLKRVHVLRVDSQFPDLGKMAVRKELGQGAQGGQEVCASGEMGEEEFVAGVEEFDRFFVYLMASGQQCQR